MAFEAIAQLSEAQIQDLHQLYQSAWWSQGRTLADMRRMLQHSDVIVGLCDRQTGKLVGFARVLTDYVYRAVILDVIVDRAYQGQGLGSSLIETILNHPSLQSVETFLLTCLPEIVPFYQKFGFDLGQMQLMQRKGQFKHSE